MSGDCIYSGEVGNLWERVWVWDVGRRKGWLDLDLIVYTTELARVLEAVIIIMWPWLWVFAVNSGISSSCRRPSASVTSIDVVRSIDKRVTGIRCGRTSMRLCHLVGRRSDDVVDIEL
jgi:hypothetical protein